MMFVLLAGFGAASNPSGFGTNFGLGAGPSAFGQAGIRPATSGTTPFSMCEMSSLFSLLFALLWWSR